MAKKSEKLREELEAALEAERELAERYGIEEPENDGEVAYLWFTQGDEDLNRVAIRENGNWLVAGEQYTFTTLADFVMQAEERGNYKFMRCWGLNAPELSVGSDTSDTRGLGELFAALFGQAGATADDEDAEGSSGPSRSAGTHIGGFALDLRHQEDPAECNCFVHWVLRQANDEEELR